VSSSGHSAFAALRHRDFRLLWLGQIVSITGSQMQFVAINWHVYLLTNPHSRLAWSDCSAVYRSLFARLRAVSLRTQSIAKS
jgi:hypothetical protein